MGKKIRDNPSATVVVLCGGVGMKAETFECACGHKLTGRKITLDSKDMLVCPKCKRTHYIDAEFVDWKKANESRNTH